MTDITERLRSLYVQHGTDYVQEAADEIERLRDELSDAAIKLENEKIGAEEIYQENDRVMHDCQNFLNEIERLRAEIERLRAELAKQQSLTRAGLDLVEIQQRRTEKEITCLTAERDRAAPTLPSVPAGWQLVPVEPTEAMIYAATSEMIYKTEPHTLRIWYAMLASAPKPEDAAPTPPSAPMRQSKGDLQ